MDQPLKMCVLQTELNWSVADPRGGGNLAMAPTLKLKAVITPRKLLLHMPGNAVCRLQKSSNHLVDGAICHEPCWGSLQLKSPPQNPAAFRLGLCPQNIFSLWIRQSERGGRHGVGMFSSPPARSGQRCKLPSEVRH